MEAIINARQLREQVRCIQGIFTGKETIPILSRVRIDAETQGILRMTATDLDVTMIVEQEVDVLQGGSICLNGRKLGEITGNLPNETVLLKLDARGEKLEFRAGKFKSKLSGIGSEQFPEILETNAEAIKFPVAAFYQGLRRTIFAANENSQRFTINGVLLLLEESTLTMVSTDGTRLCWFRIAVESSANLRCLIPIKAARELRQMLAAELRTDPKSEISVKKGSQLEFTVANKRMTARELSGNFPNWELVIPKEFAYFAEIDVARLREAVMRVSVMSEDENRRIEFEFRRHRLSVKAEAPETGHSSEDIDCKFQAIGNDGVEPTGEKSETADCWTIAFNYKFLMDFLTLHDTKQIDQRLIIRFGVNNFQCILTLEGEEHLFSYVLVPLKS